MPSLDQLIADLAQESAALLEARKILHAPGATKAELLMANHAIDTEIGLLTSAIVAAKPAA